MNTGPVGLNQPRRRSRNYSLCPVTGAIVLAEFRSAVAHVLLVVSKLTDNQAIGMAAAAMLLAAGTAGVIQMFRGRSKDHGLPQQEPPTSTPPPPPPPPPRPPPPPPPPTPPRTDMNEKVALEILGLDKGAAREDVVLAHRRLMRLTHPDRGGSDYLSKQLNAARDFLLERL